MIIHKLAAIVVFAAGVGACGDNDPTTGFETSLSSTEARMTIGGSVTWFWNEMPEADFVGWYTDPGPNWNDVVAEADLTLYQNATTQLGGSIVLNGGFEQDYDTVELSPGSRIVYPPLTAQVAPFDRATVGLAVGDAPVHCSLEETRLIVALSSYDGGNDALMAKANASAIAEGNPTPQSWSDVVHDQTMYQFLFVENATMGLATATFAYVTVYLLPTCADQRLFFVADQDFMGPVTQIR